MNLTVHTSLRGCTGRLWSGQLCNSGSAFNIEVLGETHRLCAICVRETVVEWEKVEHEVMMYNQRLTSLNAAAEEEYL